MRVPVWLSILMLLAGGLLAGAAVAGPGQKKGGTLRLALSRDIDSVDPAIAYVPESWMVEFATCAKLYSYPDRPAPQGAVVVPEMATGFPKVSRDGRTQTVQLKRT